MYRLPTTSFPELFPCLKVGGAGKVFSRPTHLQAREKPWERGWAAHWCTRVPFMFINADCSSDLKQTKFLSAIWIYGRSYISTVERDMKTWLIITFIRTGLEPKTFAIPVQCSTDWAIKPSGSWSPCEIVTLAERCTGIAEVLGSNPVEAWIFFRL